MVSFYRGKSELSRGVCIIYLRQLEMIENLKRIFKSEKICTRTLIFRFREQKPTKLESCTIFFFFEKASKFAIECHMNKRNSNNSTVQKYCSKMTLRYRPFRTKTIDANHNEKFFFKIHCIFIYEN